MFNVKRFSEILEKISDSYSSISEFAEKSEVNRTYLSKYINMKLDNPPTPKILEKIANASNRITSYDELMFICGYSSPIIDIHNNNCLKLKKDLSELNLNEYEIETICNYFLSNNLEQDLQLSPELKQMINNLSKDELSKFYDIINKFESNLMLDYDNYEKQLQDKINRRNIFTVKDKQFYMCPVYGKISAGIPNWAEECLEGYLPIDPNLMGIINPEECFFLLVNGESMNKVIRNGAYALIRKQDIVENGEICAVLVNGFEATLKKFSKQGDLVILEPMSDDSSFTTQVYNKDTQIKILGKYIGKFEINK